MRFEKISFLDYWLILNLKSKENNDNKECSQKMHVGIHLLSK